MTLLFGKIVPFMEQLALDIDAKACQLPQACMMVDQDGVTQRYYTIASYRRGDTIVKLHMRIGTAMLEHEITLCFEKTEQTIQSVRDLLRVAGLACGSGAWFDGEPKT